MYQDHFGLHTPPFRLTPDPGFLYFSHQHQEALAHLLYALDRGSGGFAAITGEVGTGKTTLCRALLERLPGHVECALILNSLLNGEQLLAAITQELGMQPTGERRTLHDQINRYLLDAYSQGKSVVVIIDEAQNLDHEALEQLRLLTNLETGSDKLMQIILLGQPELREKLSRPSLRQLNQRVSVRFHLTELTRAESGAYIEHRLQCAGAQSQVFSNSALRVLCRAGKGVPRRLNILADRAMLGCYAAGRRTVVWHDVTRAVAEIEPDSSQRRHLGIGALGLGLVLLASLVPLLTNSPIVRPPPTAIALPAATTSGQREPRTASTAIAIPDWDSDEQWRALGRLWGLSASELPEQSDCLEWRFEQFRCVTGRLAFDAILALGRPVLVEIRQQPVLLTASNGLAIVGTHERLAITQELFEMLSGGRYWALFTLPEAVPDTMRSGMRGPEVAWVGSLLDEALGHQELARLRDTVDNGMLEQQNQIREALGLPLSDVLRREDFWILTALAKYPDKPSISIDSTGER